MKIKGWKFWNCRLCLRNKFVQVEHSLRMSKSFSGKWWHFSKNHLGEKFCWFLFFLFFAHTLTDLAQITIFFSNVPIWRGDVAPSPFWICHWALKSVTFLLVMPFFSNFEEKPHRFKWTGSSEFFLWSKKNRKLPNCNIHLPQRSSIFTPSLSPTSAKKG